MRLCVEPGTFAPRYLSGRAFGTKAETWVGKNVIAIASLAFLGPKVVVLSPARIV